MTTDQIPATRGKKMANRIAKRMAKVMAKLCPQPQPQPVRTKDDGSKSKQPPVVGRHVGRLDLVPR